jgi:thymidylate synthase ThyX
MVHQLTDYVRQKNPQPQGKREIAAWRGATKAQACDAVRPVLPVSTRATVGIYGSAQAIESLIMHLMADELHESRLTGQRMLAEARKVIPAFLERADNPQRGGATIAYLANKKKRMAEIVRQLPKVTEENSGTNVELLSYWPDNELDIVPDLLFEESGSSTDAIKKSISGLNRDEKRKIMVAYMGERLNRRHRPGRAMEKPHYEWEVKADYGTFRDLQRHRVIDGLEWQKLTTAYGFEVPKLVEEAGLAEDFRQCFRISENLVEYLSNLGFIDEAQYATLFGHLMRYKFTLNARAAFHFIELRSSPQGHPGYRKIVTQMYEQLGKVHPTIAESMIFVNKDEDPELTRMAAELATQYKLEKLEGLK